MLGPYVAKGIRNGDKCVVIARPDVAVQLCEWLTAQGLNTDEVCKDMQLLLHPGEPTGYVKDAEYQFVKKNGEVIDVLTIFPFDFAETIPYLSKRFSFYISLKVRRSYVTTIQGN